MRDWAPGANRVLARGFVAGIPGFESCAPQEFALLGHVGRPTVVAGNPGQESGHKPERRRSRLRPLLGARGRCFGGVSELLAGVLVTVEDVRLDAAIPSLPGSEIDVHFSARLGLTRRAREVHDEFMRPSAFGNAASLPQELLQVEDLVGIADIDVHAAGRSEVAANRVARLTVVPNAGVSIGPLAAVLAQAFRPRASA